MAETSRNFSQAKMNKDLDERVVPVGQYRDAYNVQISTSDGSDVGSLQTLLGNAESTPSVVPDTTYTECVGSIALPEKDLIYFLISGQGFGANTPDIQKDYIVEYDTVRKTFKYVFVDIFGVKTSASTTVANSTTFTIPDLGNSTVNITGVRIGMKIVGGNANFNTEHVVEDIAYDTGNARWTITTNNNISINSGDLVRFSAPRVLEFAPGNRIPAINILEGMIMWTDNIYEPKKVNIRRSIAGTGGVAYLQGGGIAGTGSANTATTHLTNDNLNNNNATWHTRLTVTDHSLGANSLRVRTNPAKNKAVWARKDHITVIKKNPRIALELEMSKTASNRTNPLNTQPNAIFSPFTDAGANSTFWNATDNEPLDTGATITVSFDNVVDYRVGDVILFVNDVPPNVSQDAFPAEVATVRAVVTSIPAASNPPFVISSGPYELEILSADALLTNVVESWQTRLEQEKPLFEYKFPRFSYRWKYEDGEYSCYAPFSEVAFMPGDFDYLPKKGYNLGMRNGIRTLKLKNYFQEFSAVPEDVVGLELLYKEAGKNEVYSVKELKEFDAQGQDGQVWQDWATNAYARRGEYTITSEIIHALLPSNQLLRPYDNVPRKARAQEVTANRLVYGNYVQNYNIDETLRLDVGYHATDIAPSGVEDLEIATLSCKSIRTYQVGVVFGDEYGRETPVQVPKMGGSIKIPKANSITSNRLTAKLLTDPPKWAQWIKYYVKETSNEYYNVAMDRFYDAEDGNVWISFPSAERNKIDQDTYLILKKQHDSATAVLDQARYKVIAIANEPPTFIKQHRKSYGMIQAAFNTAGAPALDSTFVLVDKDDFLGSFSSVVSPSLKDNLEVRFGGNVNGSLLSTDYYEIGAISVPESGSWVKITLQNKLKNDANFLTGLNAGTQISLEIIENVLKHKPEFDGRFFVKIYKDLVLQNRLITTFTDTIDYAVVDTMKVGYENNHSGNDEDWWQDRAYDFSGDRYSITSGWFYDDIAGYDFSSVYYTAAAGGDTGMSAGGARRMGNRSYIDVSFANFDSPANLSGVDTTKTIQPPGWLPNGPDDFNVPLQRLTATGSLIRFAEDPLQVIYEIEQVRGKYCFLYNNGLAFPGLSGVLEDPGAANPLVGAASDARWNYDRSGNNNDHESHNQRVGLRLRLKRFRDGDLNLIDDAAVGNGDFNFGDINNPDVADNGGVVGHGWYPMNSRRVDIDGTGAKSWWMQADNNLVRPSALGGVDETNTTLSAGGGTCAHHSSGRFNAANSMQTMLEYGGSGTVFGSTNNGAAVSTIEFIEPFISTDVEGGANFSSTNPAIWETEPKEDVGLDIYYEASGAIPINFDHTVNELILPYETTFEHEGNTHRITAIDNYTYTFTPAIATSNIATNTAVKFERFDNMAIEVFMDGAVNIGATTLTIHAGRDAIPSQYATHHNKVHLGWYNCWAWGNGVESDRIRDDFNAPQLDNGVRASTTLAEPYQEERRKNGFIWSGIFNSISGVNELNQFIQAEPITKDINPSHGSIQKMYARNTDTIAFCEDKVLSILTNKDALFNADGNANVTATSRVLGAATPMGGDYGISTDPMSFAATPYAIYFADQMRGRVLKLEGQASIKNISDIGMKDYFNDQFKDVYDILGTYDDKKNEYNITWGYKSAPKAQKNSIRTTASFSESVDGWVSFKSFTPESGLSLNNEYYTWKDGMMYQHHVEQTLAGTGVNKNYFYGVQYYPSVNLIFNDMPEAVKSWQLINYEGTQSRITQFLQQSATDAAGNTFNVDDGRFDNLTSKTGWYVDSMTTNLQTTNDLEFINKEDKWFGYVVGDCTNIANLDESEFSVQGLGVATITTSGSSSQNFTFTIKDDPNGTTWDTSGVNTDEDTYLNIDEHSATINSGTSVSADTVDLTISNIVGGLYSGLNLSAKDFTIGGSATVVTTANPFKKTVTNNSGWNADSGILKVEFTDNGTPYDGSNTVNAKVYYDAFTMPSSNKTLKIDIDYLDVFANSNSTNQVAVKTNVPSGNVTVGHTAQTGITASSITDLASHTSHNHTGTVVKDQTSVISFTTVTADGGYYLEKINGLPLQVHYKPGNDIYTWEDFYTVEVADKTVSNGLVTAATVKISYTPPPSSDLKLGSDPILPGGSFIDWGQEFYISHTPKLISAARNEDSLSPAVISLNYLAENFDGRNNDVQGVTITANKAGVVGLKVVEVNSSDVIQNYYNFSTQAFQSGDPGNYTVEFTKAGSITNYVNVPVTSTTKIYSAFLTEITVTDKTTLDVPTGNNALTPDAAGEKKYYSLAAVRANLTADAPTNASVSGSVHTDYKSQNWQKLKTSRVPQTKTSTIVYAVTEGRSTFGIARQPRTIVSGQNYPDFKGLTMKGVVIGNTASATATTITLPAAIIKRLVTGMSVVDPAYANSLNKNSDTYGYPKNGDGTTISSQRINTACTITNINTSTNVITISHALTGALVATDKLDFVSPWNIKPATATAVLSNGNATLTTTVTYNLNGYGNEDVSGDVTLLTDYIS